MELSKSFLPVTSKNVKIMMAKSASPEIRLQSLSRNLFTNNPMRRKKAVPLNSDRYRFQFNDKRGKALSIHHFSSFAISARNSDKTLAGSFKPFALDAAIQFCSKG